MLSFLGGGSVVVYSLFIVAPIVVCGCPCFVIMQYFVSFLVLQSSHFGALLMSCGCYRSLPFARGAVSCPAVCDCGIYWSYSLPFGPITRYPGDLLSSGNANFNKRLVRYILSELCVTETLFLDYDTVSSKFYNNQSNFNLYVSISQFFGLPE